MLSLYHSVHSSAIDTQNDWLAVTELPYPAQYDNGYTILELLITLTIIGIITTGSSIFLSVWQNSRITTISNLLITDLNRARSEAVLRAHTVTMCQSPDGRQCGDSDHWEMGWILFADRNANKRVDMDETVIYTRAALGHSFRLRWRASGRSNNHVSYFPLGGANKNGSFTLCPGSNLSSGRAIIVIRSGRARISRNRADGSPLACSAA